MGSSFSCLCDTVERNKDVPQHDYYLSEDVSQHDYYPAVEGGNNIPQHDLYPTEEGYDIPHNDHYSTEEEDYDIPQEDHYPTVKVCNDIPQQIDDITPRQLLTNSLMARMILKDLPILVKSSKQKKNRISTFLMSPGNPERFLFHIGNVQERLADESVHETYLMIDMVLRTLLSLYHYLLDQKSVESHSHAIVAIIITFNLLAKWSKEETNDARCEQFKLKKRIARHRNLICHHKAPTIGVLVDDLRVLLPWMLRRIIAQK